jgi:DNA-binding transcriptional LysR family regulator
VWEQVHALEHAFAVSLIERRAHGCRLTEAGRLLLELLAPLLAGIDSLKQTLQEVQGREEMRLTVATTQRILVEDLPEPILAFERLHPHVRVCFLERSVEHISTAVESGEADLGLTPEHALGTDGPWLVYEPSYELEYFLITPKDHPLARRRSVHPRDLRGFPLVNAREGGSFPDPVIATLEKFGIFQTQPRRIEAVYTPVIRRYVEMGFGIGLIVGLPSRPPSPNLHERSMSRHLGRLTIYLVWRRGVLRQGPVGAFTRTITTMLKR